MERVGAAAAFVERDHLAFDAIQRGGQRLADRVPGFVLGFVGAAAHVTVSVGAEVDQRGHGQLLSFSIQLKVHGKLRGDGPHQLAPGVSAAQGQFGGESFQFLRHQVFALLGGFLQVEGVRLRGRVMRQGCINGGRDASEPGGEADAEFSQGDGGLLIFGLEPLGDFVVRVRIHVEGNVSADRVVQQVGVVEAIHDFADDLAKFLGRSLGVGLGDDFIEIVAEVGDLGFQLPEGGSKFFRFKRGIDVGQIPARRGGHG